MTLINNNTEYIHRKLNGEDVVPVATLYGFQAMRCASGDFLVVEFNEDNHSVYHYKDTYFRISEYKESLFHSLPSVIRDFYINNKSVKKWWNSVFYESNGKCLYDFSYDSLRISEESPIPFFKLIAEVSDFIRDLHFPTLSSDLFLTGDLSRCPVVRYVFQQMVRGYNVNVLSPVSEEDYINKPLLVPVPQIILEAIQFSVNDAVPFKMKVAQPVKIRLPLCSLDKEIMPGVRWTDMVCDKRKDYSVGNFEFKIIFLLLESDPFQNVFLSCFDMNGNRIVKQIK